MSWQLLIAISIILASLSTVLQRYLLKNDKVNPIFFSAVFQFICGVFIGIFGFFSGQLSFPWIPYLVINFIFMIVLYGAGNIFVFKSLSVMEASRYTVLFTSRAIITVIASTFVLHEGLNVNQLVGLLFVLGGVIYVTTSSFRFKIEKGDFLVILASICFGLAVTNDRFLLGHYELYSYVSLAFILPAVCVGLVNYKLMPKISKIFNKKYFLNLCLLCGMYAAAAITFFKALQINTNSSQVASINQVVTIVTVLLSVLLLKEKKDLSKKFIGATLSVIGLILLA